MDNIVEKVEGVTQEINTGKTLDDIYAAQAAIMEPLSQEAYTNLYDTILKFVQQNEDKFFILNSKKLNYITIFYKEFNDCYFADVVADFLLNDEGLKAIGGLKMFTDEDNTNIIHLYVGETHFALFAADDYVISSK